MLQGDSHNFGRRVVLNSGGRSLFKPRTLNWEWLVLGKDSPLRLHIDALSKGAGRPSPFEAIPALGFDFDPHSPWRGGQVERLTVEDAETIGVGEAASVGRSIALLAFLGVSDLHSENIMFGRSTSGRLIFAPIDIEDMFNDFIILSQTLLLPSNDLRPHVPGMSKLLRLMRESPRCAELTLELCIGYFETMSWLQPLEKRIIDLLAAEVPNFFETPSRLIFRGTRIYGAKLKNEWLGDGEGEFCLAELEQLKRGDIPYFFRTIGSDVVHTLGEDGSTVAVEVPSSIARKVFDYLGYQSREMHPRVNIGRLRDAGVLQLVRALDLGNLRKIEISRCNLEYGQKMLSLRFGRYTVRCDRKFIKL